jgi:adenosine deaminase
MTIPTVELHRHFEAGLRPDAIARFAARHGVTVARSRAGLPLPEVDPQDPASIRRYYQSIASGWGAADGFARFVDSFGLPLGVLLTVEDLEEAVFDQIVDCAAGGSLHTELRGSPFTYAERIDAPLEEIAEALVAGVDRAWTEKGASGTFILAFSRQKGLGPESGPAAGRQGPAIARMAATLHRADRPVGLDMAGFPEVPFPPRDFVEALAPAREAGVPLTIHSGEQGRPPDYADAPPALAAEAIELLGTLRIGHGTALEASPEVRRLVKARKIGIESCPLSNSKMGFVPLARHPLRRFLDEGLLVSAATDDPLMFGPMTVAETLDAIAPELPLSDAERWSLAENGIATAFVTEPRREWLRWRLAESRLGG